MPVDVVVGMQWGDEGKGKVVDLLSENYSAVVRYAGGSNAGHTVYIGDEPVVLHLVPSGILYEGKSNVLGNEMVIDPVLLAKEIKGLRERGLLNGNLYVSNRAHVTLPHYYDIEDRRERVLNIGTTRMGIGPTYEFMVNRSGIRMCDLQNETKLRERIVRNVQVSREFLTEGYTPDIDELTRNLMESYEEIKRYVTDTSFLINEWLNEGMDVLLEGAQGTHLDVVHGTYPHVTSSHPTVGGALIGTGIGPHRVRNVYGVVKDYSTRVGGGAFPTEMGSERDLIGVEKGKEVFTDRDRALMETGNEKAIAKFIRIKGQEYGGTTGRPRRIGWLDLISVLYSMRVNGVNRLVLTRVDMLDELDVIDVATAYQLNGRLIDEVHEPFPASEDELERCVPLYDTHLGWNQSTYGITEYDELPDHTRRHVEKIEERLELPIHIISTGPRRHETIVRSL